MSSMHIHVYSCVTFTKTAFFWLSGCNFSGLTGLEKLKYQREPSHPFYMVGQSHISTLHSNAGSLTHWARPGIEPSTSWFLVGFVNHWATMGTPLFLFLIFFFCLCLQHAEVPRSGIKPMPQWWAEPL